MKGKLLNVECRVKEITKASQGRIPQVELAVEEKFDEQKFNYFLEYQLNTVLHITIMYKTCVYKIIKSQSYLLYIVINLLGVKSL